MIEIIKHLMEVLKDIILEFLDKILCYSKILWHVQKTKGIEKGTYCVSIPRKRNQISIAVSAKDNGVIFHDHPSNDQTRYVVNKQRVLILNVEYKDHFAKFSSKCVFSRFTNYVIYFFFLLVLLVVTIYGLEFIILEILSHLRG